MTNRETSQAASLVGNQGWLFTYIVFFMTVGTLVCANAAVTLLAALAAHHARGVAVGAFVALFGVLQLIVARWINDLRREKLVSAQVLHGFFAAVFVLWAVVILGASAALGLGNLAAIVVVALIIIAAAGNVVAILYLRKSRRLAATIAAFAGDASYYGILAQGKYGSFEVKKWIGPYLIRGLAISVIIHALVIAAPYIISAIRGEEVIPPMPRRVFDMSTLLQLHTQDNAVEQLRIAQPKLAQPKNPKVIAVPEDQVPVEQALPLTQTEIKAQVSASSDTALDIKPGEKIEIKDDLAGEAIPDMGTFVPFEVLPQPLEATNPKPVFPELARTAGLTGKVTVNVYVDKHGDVKKWKIIKAVPKGLGFEEEVEKVIGKWKFTPALQQGNPVGVWVAVPVNFNYVK